MVQVAWHWPALTCLVRGGNSLSSNLGLRSKSHLHDLESENLQYCALGTSLVLALRKGSEHHPLIQEPQSLSPHPQSTGRMVVPPQQAAAWVGGMPQPAQLHRLPGPQEVLSAELAPLHSGS